MTGHGKSLRFTLLIKLINKLPTSTQNNHVLIIQKHFRFCDRVRDPPDPDLFIALAGLQLGGAECCWGSHWLRDDAAMVGARLVSGHADSDDLDARGLRRQEIPPGLSFSGCGIRSDAGVEHDSAHANRTSSGRDHHWRQGRRPTADF